MPDNNDQSTELVEKPSPIMQVINSRGEWLEEMVRWALDAPSEMTEETEKAIANVLRDRKRRVQVFLTGLARKQIERIVYLVSKYPLVENELLDEKRISTARTSDLVRLFSTMAAQVEHASEFLRAFVSDDELRSDPPPGRAPIDRSSSLVDTASVTDEEKEAASELSSQSRRRVQHVLRRVVDALQDAETGGKSKAVLHELKPPTE